MSLFFRILSFSSILFIDFLRFTRNQRSSNIAHFEGFFNNMSTSDHTISESACQPNTQIGDIHMHLSKKGVGGSPTLSWPTSDPNSLSQVLSFRHQLPTTTTTNQIQPYTRTHPLGPHAQFSHFTFMHVVFYQVIQAKYYRYNTLDCWVVDIIRGRQCGTRQIRMEQPQFTGHHHLRMF